MTPRALFRTVMVAIFSTSMLLVVDPASVFAHRPGWIFSAVSSNPQQLRQNCAKPHFRGVFLAYFMSLETRLNSYVYRVS